MNETSILEDAPLCGQCVWSRVTIDRTFGMTITHCLGITCQNNDGCIKEFSEKVTGIEKDIQADVDYETQCIRLGKRTDAWGLR